MDLIPRRVSLVEQVVEILRESLHESRWPDQLPGEHQLSDLLQVSRSTLRQALGLLRREGLLRTMRGSRWRPASGAGKRRPAAPATVAMISSLPLHRQSWHSIIILDELRRHLQHAGLELQVHAMAQSNRKSGGRSLEGLLARTRAACWILSSCSGELQRRFQRHPGPTIVLGSCHRGVDLPYFRLDIGAACRHAVGVLHRRGHQRLGLLLPRSPFASAPEVEESMRLACAALPGPGSEPIVRHHENNAAGVERTVSALMQSPARPTALIVMMPADALTAQCVLLSRGFRIPGQVSLICLFDDLYLTRVTPVLARYTSNHTTFARGLARRVLSMARSGNHPASVSIFPDFVAGATVGPATED